MEIVNLLIEKGAIVQPPQEGLRRGKKMNALRYAVRTGSLDIVKHVVSAGNLNLRDYDAFRLLVGISCSPSRRKHIYGRLVPSSLFSVIPVLISLLSCLPLPSSSSSSFPLTHIGSIPCDDGSRSFWKYGKRDSSWRANTILSPASGLRTALLLGEMQTQSQKNS